MTTTPSRWRFDRQVSLALIVAIAVQAAGALLWAGRASARIDQLEQRVAGQASVSERLARLEAQGEAVRAAVSRIETKLDREG